MILASVNTSVATPKTLRNRAELNWNGGVTTLSNNVSYRVLPSGSLPGTGIEPLPDQAGLRDRRITNPDLVGDYPGIRWSGAT